MQRAAREDRVVPEDSGVPEDEGSPMSLRSPLRDTAGPSRASGGEAVLLVAATVALLVATASRASSPATGFDLPAVLSALAGQLPVTLPAALLVSAAMVLNIAAGACALRMVRRAPFAGWQEAVLAGMAGSVVLDVALVYVLGGIGWFRASVLLSVLAGSVLAGATRGPIVATGTRRRAGTRVRWLGVARALLVTAAWASVLIVWLASPVVPAADVLPNHVAPAEHLRAFGSIATLATYPSPIYGPSRLFLGYEALMGVLATLTGLPAALAVAASMGWLTVVTVIAARRLAAASFGRDADFWALVAMLGSFTFVRLVDVRDSVVALPLAALALVALVGSSRERRRDGPADGGVDWLLAFALTGATLVHPLVGALTWLTVALVTIADPARHLRRTGPALAATAVAVLPEAAVMVGLEPPPIVGLAALLGAAAAAVLAARAIDGLPLDRAAPGRHRDRLAVLAAVALGASAVLAFPLRTQVGEAFGWLNPAFPLLFAAAAACALGVARGSRGGRGLMLAGLGSGAVLMLVAASVPDSSLVGQAIRYEVPKAVGYWLPWVAVPALAGLVAAATRRAARRTVWLAVPAVVLAVVLLPSGQPLPDSAQASHATADVTAERLRSVELGYWQGYPDPRALVDDRGTAVVAYLQGEIASGHLRSADRLLHVAASYQAWASIPVAPLTGIDETMVAPDASVTIFTSGGRVLPMSALATELRSGFEWMLLETTGLPASVRAAIAASGYRSVFRVAGAEVFEIP
jgi:hypothetical protein